MMVETRWNKMFLLLMLVLQFSGALSGQLVLSYIVREGDEATLSCENVMNDHRNCDTTTWFFSNSRGREAVELVVHGQIKNEINKDRLSLTANCSLVIKKVTVEDADRYTCRQYKSGKQQGQDALVDLSVVTVTGHKHTDLVTLNCDVRTNGRCGHTVKWVLKGQDLDKDNPNIKSSQSDCSATLDILNNFGGSSIPYDDIRKLFKCSVSTEDTKEPLTFNLRPSDVDTGTTTANSCRGVPTMEGFAIGCDTAKLHGQWRIIVVALGLAALITAAVAVNIWTRTKGNKTQTGENGVCNDEDDGL